MDLRQYTQRTVQTATPGQLVVMLYDGMIRFFTQARAAMESGDVQTMNERVGRGLAIVTELRCSLNLEAGGQIASNLDALYDFAFRRIVDGQIQHEASIIGEVVSVLDPIRDAWTTAVCGAAAPVTELRSVGAGA